MPVPHSYKCYYLNLRGVLLWQMPFSFAPLFNSDLSAPIFNLTRAPFSFSIRPASPHECPFSALIKSERMFLIKGLFSLSWLDWIGVLLYRMEFFRTVTLQIINFCSLYSSLRTQLQSILDNVGVDYIYQCLKIVYFALRFPFVGAPFFLQILPFFVGPFVFGAHFWRCSAAPGQGK